MTTSMMGLLVRHSRAAVSAHGAQASRWSARLFSSASSDASASSSSGSSYSGPPKLVVFGGRGFVGSHVCAEAVGAGLGVVAVSRAGTPPLSREAWVGGVTWARGNALEPQTFMPYLAGAEAVVSCIGGFGTQEEMLRTNGAANVAVIEAARAAGVKRFVFISAHIPNIPGIDSVLSGYVHGKRQAEEALRAAFPSTGVALRPSVIYGDRVVSQGLTVPLGLVFQPLEGLIARLGPGARRVAEGVPFLGAALLPPVSVQAVARAAVRAATDPAVPGGVIDVWELSAEYKG